MSSVSVALNLAEGAQGIVGGGIHHCWVAADHAEEAGCEIASDSQPHRS